jgi:branched-chain amino acid transport system permease protein
MIMVMFSPGGISSLLMMNLRLAKHGKLHSLIPAYGVLAAASLVLLVAVAALVEVVYHRQLNSAMGSALNFMGLALDTASTQTWLGLLAAIVVGGWLFSLAQRHFANQWDAVQELIEKESHYAGAAP